MASDGTRGLRRNAARAGNSSIVGLIGIAGLDRRKACFLDKIDQPEALQRIVFDDQNESQARGG